MQMSEPSKEKIHRDAKSFALPKKGQLATLVVAIALSLLIVAAAETPTGKYVVAPGTVESLREAVRVGLETGRDNGGAASPTIDAGPQGGIRLVTVRTWPASLADLAYAAVRSDVEVIEDSSGGESDREREERSASQLLASEMIAQLVAFREAAIPVTLTGSGARIEDVSAEPAKERLMVGDVITAVDGIPVKISEDIRKALSGKSPGDEVSVEVSREGRPLSLTVKLSPGPDDKRPVLLGVLVSTVDVRIESPYKVEFDLRGIGGPSAGLAFALEIYMRVTGKDLTDGKLVVATGELDFEGHVRAVGGVEQKAVAASQAGADILVVPSENSNEARRAAPGTEILAVSTFSEAVSSLRALATVD